MAIVLCSSLLFGVATSSPILGSGTSGVIRRHAQPSILSNLGIVSHEGPTNADLSGYGNRNLSASSALAVSRPVSPSLVTIGDALLCKLNSQKYEPKDINKDTDLTQSGWKFRALPGTLWPFVVKDIGDSLKSLGVPVEDYSNSGAWHDFSSTNKAGKEIEVSPHGRRVASTHRPFGLCILND